MKKLLEFLFCRMFKGIMFVVYAYSIQNIEEVCAWYEIELFILVSTRMFFQIFHLQHFDFFLLYQNGSFILSNLLAQNTQQKGIFKLGSYSKVMILHITSETIFFCRYLWIRFPLKFEPCEVMVYQIRNYEERKFSKKFYIFIFFNSYKTFIQ